MRNYALILLVSLLAIGCATITRGVEEIYVVQSDPVGAMVIITYDKPVVLYVEQDMEPTPTGGVGVNESEKETITLEKMHGLTPASFRIPRRGCFTVRIEKKGYQPVVTRVETQIATHGGAALAGNICLGGCLGTAVDAGSGATLEHVPGKIDVKLEKIQTEDELRS
ncbi:MAG: hypothetical protein K9M96_06390 [Deltaproteobacteria bacterium]|nr:hypothetical protein [Deltaproteobacteria bacterium]